MPTLKKNVKSRHNQVTIHYCCSPEMRNKLVTATVREKERLGIPNLSMSSMISRLITQAFRDREKLLGRDK